MDFSQSTDSNDEIKPFLIQYQIRKFLFAALGHNRPIKKHPTYANFEKFQ
jgi:hypothetical protein